MRAFATVLCVLALSAGLAAQVSKGTIRGTVIDALGAAASGRASIELESRLPAVSAKMSARLNADGTFEFSGLSAGRYIVRADIDGLELSPERWVTLGEGRTLDIELSAGQIHSPCMDLTAEETAGNIPGNQRGEILRAVLERTAAVYRELTGGRPGKIPLAQENLERGWFSDEAGRLFELFDPDAVVSKADADDGIRYVKIRSVKFVGLCADVEVDIVNRAQRSSDTVFLDGDFRTYEVRRFAGDWRVRVTQRMIG